MNSNYKQKKKKNKKINKKTNKKTNNKRVKKVMRGGVDNGIKVGDVVDLLPYIKTTNQTQGYTIDDTKFTNLLYLVTGIYSSNHERRHNNNISYLKSFSPTTFIENALCLVYVGDNNYLGELRENLRVQYSEKIAKDIIEEYKQVNEELDKITENDGLTRNERFNKKKPLFERREILDKAKTDKWPIIMPEEMFTPHSIIIIRKDVIEKSYMSGVYPQPSADDTVKLYIDKTNDYDDFNETSSTFNIIEIPNNPGGKFKIRHNRNTNEIREQKLGDFYIIKLSEKSKKEVEEKLGLNK